MKKLYSIFSSPFASFYVIGFFLITFVISVSLGGCTDEKGTEKILKINNYKPIEIGGYGWLDGDKSDIYKTRFKAVAPNGDTVSGTVTKGWFKGGTIRID
jgi:hypothetical protein